MIISNPPYVRSGDWSSLAPEIRRWEPRRALTAGSDGLGVIRPLIHQSAARLKPRGFLAVEFGHGQERLVRALLKGDLWTKVDIHQDDQGCARFFIAQAAANF